MKTTGRKKQKRDWSKVADEMCECGHLKSVHKGAVNHLGCGIVRCKCPRFSWAYFVDADGRRLA